jgi:hypothetical protein
LNRFLIQGRKTKKLGHRAAPIQHRRCNLGKSEQADSSATRESLRLTSAFSESDLAGAQTLEKSLYQMTEFSQSASRLLFDGIASADN